ncbi:helix-turn-helix domain-containing protein [Streptomyces anulatus]|uniref:hypothetical protein n=1 Tax=Streptomyces anulatus TaxID=1892 RepID=UPI0036C9F874
MTSNYAPNGKELQQILTLLHQGLPNAEIHRRLFIGVRTIRRIREDAGIPPVPHSEFRRQPHPHEATIHQLLEDGHTDAEIRRRTGADLRTISRRRATAKIGAPTIVKGPRDNWVHPKDSEVRSLLAQLSNEKIAAELGVDRSAVSRIRKLAGIEWSPPQPSTAEEKWASCIVAVDGGHTEWTGPRSSASGTPVMRFRGKSVSPAGIAFRKHTGRGAVGQVRAECGFQHCMTPAHVEDGAGRQRLRSQMRAIRGLGSPPAHCRHGHDQAEHGRFEQGGEAYCEVCKRDQKRTVRTTCRTQTDTENL